MALSNFDKASLTGRVPPFEVAFEVYMKRKNYDSWAYVDINKSNQDNPIDEGWRRLHALPKWKIKPIDRSGRCLVPSFKVQLRNDDGIFGQDPETLRFWKDGIEYGITAWDNVRAQIVLVHNEDNPGGAISRDVMGTFIFSGEVAQDSSDIAVATLADPLSILSDTSASDMKRGDTWFSNWHITALVKELINTTSHGELEPSSEIVDRIEFTSEKKRFSVLGNVPVKNTDGTRYENRDFVPRHQCADQRGLSQVIFQVGYSRQYNCPAAARWDRDTDTWLYEVYPELSAGYEFVFVADHLSYNTTFIFAVSIGNFSSTQHDITLLYSAVAMIAKDTLTYSGVVGIYDTWMPNFLPTWPGSKTYYSERQYGWGPGMVEDYDDCERIAVPFKCKTSAPFRDANGVAEGQNRWGAVTGVDSETATQHTVNPRFDSADRLTRTVQKHEQRFEKGYYSAWGTADPDVAESPVYAYHHAAHHEAFKISYIHHAIVWISYDGTRYMICKYYFQNQTFERHEIRQPSYAGDDARDYTITAFCPFGNYLYVAGTHTLVENDGTFRSQIRDSMFIHRYSFGSGHLSSPTDLTPSTEMADWDTVDNYMGDNGYSWGPLICTIRATSQSTTGAPIFGTCLNHRGISGKAYGFYVAGDGMFRSSENGTSFPTSSAPFELSDREYGVSTSESVFYAQDQASGGIYEVRIGENWDPKLRFISLTENNPIDQENVWSSCNIFYDSTNDDLIGVSASGPPADTNEGIYSYSIWANQGRWPSLSNNSPAGRVSLWRYSTKVSDIIPLADFKEMKAHDALECLRQVAGRDWRTFTTKDGDINFLECPRNDGLITLRDKNFEHCHTDGTVFEVGADRITTQKYMKDLVNLIKIKTYSAERSPAIIDGIINHRIHNEIDLSAAINAIQTSTRAQRVVLTCIQGGRPVIGEDDLNDENVLLFSWAASYADLSGVLKVEATPQDTDISVAGAYQDGDNYRLGDTDFRVGDQARVGSGNVNTITNIVLFSWGVLLQLDGAVGGDGDYKVGSSVSIIPAAGRRLSDSLDGLCTVATEFSNTGVWGENSVKTLHVSSIEHIAIGMVLFVDTMMVQVVGFYDQDSSPGYLYVKPGACGTGRGYAAWPVGAVVKGAIWVRRPGQTYAVGRTGVSFTLEPTQYLTDTTGLFEVGDRVIITCNGLELREMKHSITRADNMASQNIYGIREWKPLVKPMLIDSLRAAMMLETTEEWGSPRYLTTAYGVPLLTSVQIGQPVEISHPRLWPDETVINHYIIGIEPDLATGSMTLVMLTTGAIGRDDDDGDKPPVEVPIAGPPTSGYHDRRR